MSGANGRYCGVDLRHEFNRSEEVSMSEQIDKFCSDLRTNMTMIESKFQALKAKAAGKADEAERTIHQEMDSIQKRIDESKAAVEAARAKVNEWVEEQKTATQSKIAEWKARARQRI
jgi:hypothetical protein